MTAGLKMVVYPVADPAKAKPLYTALLGVEPYVDEPYYVGFRVGDLEFGLDPNGHAAGLTGPIGYWEVQDIAAAIDRLVGAGAEIRQPVKDVGGGKLIASVTDANGNVTGLAQAS